MKLHHHQFRIGNSPKILFFNKIWLVEMLRQIRRNRERKVNRLEFLKLGEYLLRDLGFDKEGHPLPPDNGICQRRNQTRI
ncbi:MAG: hypothetical protein PVI90_04195 [Desulfobacteraceae bacterium]|jgi:hypothetical protein